MPDPGISATIVFPLFNFALRAIQTGYEIAAVPSETSDHLKTISQVLLDLKTARTLRKDKAACLSDDDLLRINRVVRNTEEALMGLECLVERARVDMSLRENSVGAQSRLMWVMRDSNKVTAALSRLTVVSLSLHSEIMGMRLAGTTSYQDAFGQHPPPKYSSKSPASVSPSCYLDLQATTEACAERREWIKRRYSVKRTESIQGVPSPTHTPSEIIQSNLLEDDIPLSSSINNVAEYIRVNEAILSTIAPVSSVMRRGELTPARLLQSDLDNEITPPGLSEVSEIDSRVPPHINPTPRRYAPATPELPYMSSRTPYTSHNVDTRQGCQSLFPAIIERPTSQVQPPGLPSDTSANGPASRVVIRRPSPNTMQSTALVFGSSVPREIVWIEPINEEPEERNIQQNANTNAANTDIDPPPEYRTLTDIQSPVGSRRQPLNRTRTRRRQPMVYSAPEPEPEPEPSTAPAMNVPVTARRDSVGRNIRVRRSRLEWALDEHNREVVHVTARNNA